MQIRENVTEQLKMAVATGARAEVALPASSTGALGTISGKSRLPPLARRKVDLDVVDAWSRRLAA
jgi:hypothetical protein